MACLRELQAKKILLNDVTQPPNPKMKKRKEKPKPGQIHPNNTKTRGKCFLDEKNKHRKIITLIAIKSPVLYSYFPRKHDVLQDNVYNLCV